MTWIYNPPWNVRVLAGIALVLLVVALLRWRRERAGARLLPLRLIVCGVLLWVLFNPQALLPRERTGKPKLIVLLDTSASMTTRDGDAASRLTLALRALTNQVTRDRLEREFVLDVRQFDREIRPVDPDNLKDDSATGDASDLAGALLGAISDLGDAKAQAGVLLISDGRATTPNTVDAAQLARARSVPIWTWTTGGSVGRHDLWVETASSEALAFSGAEVELSATLRAAGYPHRSFKMELVRDNKTLETREVVPDSAGAVRMTVKVKAPEAGEQRYVFRVSPEPEESDTANNERSVFLRSVGEKVRVLVAEGQPHWDTKFLVQTLKRDANVDLTALYRLNAQRHLAIVSSTGAETRVEKDLFPRSAAAMNAYDVIVLGRGAEAFFDNTTDGLLTDFTSKRGGSMVFARGKPYGGRFQPLSKLEPVAWGDGTAPGIKLRPTEAGRDHPLFDLGSAGTLDELLERLPALDQASVTLGEKPLAITLATAADKADGPVLVAYQRYGQGKAISLNASGLWRWAFRESGQEESELAYHRFWLSLLQWLLGGSQFLPGADVALTSARRYYTSDQPMQFLIGTRNFDRTIYRPKLLIETAGRQVEVEPRARGDNFVAEAGPFAPGTYRVTLKSNLGKPAELSQSIEVLSASVEKRELSADPDLMRQLARLSGGMELSGNDIARLPEIVQRWEAARQLAHRQRPVWDQWWILGGMVALLGSEWWLRRREGLL